MIQISVHKGFLIMYFTKWYDYSFILILDMKMKN